MATESDECPGDPFRSYTAAQANAYAIGRASAYPSLLYSTIYSFHTAGDGDYNVLLDVGCGPGNATRDLAPSFCRTVGVDPGKEMIAVAAGQCYKTKSGKDVDFRVCMAENIGELEGIEPGSVDIITVAMAAHWFDMSVFWKAAAKLLKPGGTVAIWTCASGFAHPATHNYVKVQQVLTRLEKEILAPFEVPANRLSRDMYDNLPLPWTCDPPEPAFSQDNFVRKEWDREGDLTDGKNFFGHDGHTTTLKEIERGLGTASMVTRWRAANPGLAGTEKDCVKQTIADLRAALDGGEEFVHGCGTALLLFRRN